MKKRIILIICFLLCLFPLSVHAEESDLTPNASGAILIESSSGEVIYEKNADEQLYPASMTKMMGLILIFEALNEGRLALKDSVTVSENAASMGGSQIFLEVNEVMSVEDLVKSICIASANDAMVAMAEKLSGSVINFVQQMNDKAELLGLKNTHFTNTTGLHDEQHYSSARDMALIAKKLIEVGGEQLLAITSTYDTYIREASEQPFWLVNTNKLIKQIPGVDGLKTGFTQEAKSCITVTALRDGLRLIAVVMKEPSSQVRNKEVTQLIEYGFSIYEQTLLMEEGDVVDVYRNEFSDIKEADLILLQPVQLVHRKGEEISIVNQQLSLFSIALPIEQHQQVGELIIELSNGNQLRLPVGVGLKMENCSFLELMMKIFKGMLF